VPDGGGVHRDVQRPAGEDDQGRQRQSGNLAQRYCIGGTYWRVSMEVCSALRACSRSSSTGSGFGFAVAISGSFQDR